MLKTFFSLSQRSLFSINDTVGAKLLTRLRLQFSQRLRESHEWLWCWNKNNQSLFLRYQLFANERQKPRDDVHRIDALIKNLNEESLIDVLLYCSDNFNNSKNKYFSIQSVTWKLQNVLKDVLFTNDIYWTKLVVQ